MRKSIALFTGALLFCTIPATACSRQATRESPQVTPGTTYKGVTQDPSRDAYEHYPYGQVTPLPIEQSKDTKIIAPGIANIFGGNVESARLTALRAAYAEAVARGCGQEIGRLTLIRNVKYVSDIITSRSRGFIKSFQILREGISNKDPSKYEVLIEAVVVSEGKTSDEETEALRDYLVLLGSPKLLIILPEKRIAVPVSASDYQDKEKQKTDVEYQQGDTRLRITQEKSKDTQQTDSRPEAVEEDRGDMFRSTEAALAQAFSRYGYQVVTSDDLLAQGLCSPEVLAQAKAGVTARAVEVARAAGADLAFLGVLRMTQELTKSAGVELVMVTGEASAKALVVSSGKLIDAFHRVERASAREMLKAYADCLDRVAANIASVLVWKVPQILSNEYRETKLKIMGIDLAEAQDVQQAVSKLEGIESIRLSQLPSERFKGAVFTLMSGFVLVEPQVIVETCASALNKPIKLVDSNKYEVVCDIANGQSDHSLERGNALRFFGKGR